MRNLDSLPTVQELIDKLEYCDPNTKVAIALPTHNYWGNVETGRVSENIDTAPVRYSEYLQNFQVLDEDAELDGSEVEVVFLNLEEV